MKRMVDIWEDAQKDAQKIVGKDAALPYWPADPKAIASQFNKIQDGVENTTKILLDWCNDATSLRDEFAEALSKLSKAALKSDFGLDSKSKEDAKKIADARKVLLAGVQAMQKRAETVKQQNRADLEKAFKSIK